MSYIGILIKYSLSACIILLLLAAPSYADIQLVWSDTSNQEEGFGIEWTLGPATTSSKWVLIGRVDRTEGTGNTTWTDTEPVLGKENCYRVYSYNVAGRSVANTNTVCSVPSTGTNVDRKPPATTPGQPNTLVTKDVTPAGTQRRLELMEVPGSPK